MYAVKNKRCILLKSDSKEEKMNIKRNTRSLTFLGVLIAIELVLTFAHIGFIPLPFMKATILHIPVIIGAIFLGPIEGSILGLVFGILSVVMNTIEPGVTSFVFSPFYTLGTTKGNVWSLVVALVPRVLVGITSYYTYQFMSKFDKTKWSAYIGAGIVGSLTNTVFVMSFIYLFFGQAEPYASNTAQGIGFVFKVIMGVVLTNGVPEAIVAAVLVSAIGKVLSKVFKTQRILAR